MLAFRMNLKSKPFSFKFLNFKNKIKYFKKYEQIFLQLSLISDSQMPLISNFLPLTSNIASPLMKPSQILTPQTSVSLSLSLSLSITPWSKLPPFISFICRRHRNYQVGKILPVNGFGKVHRWWDRQVHRWWVRQGGGSVFGSYVVCGMGFQQI